jgi:hypothetical protein
VPDQRFRYEEPSLADIEYLEERLYEFNEAATGIADGRSASRTVGVSGYSYAIPHRASSLAQPAIHGVRPANCARSGLPSLSDGRG